MNRMRAHTGDVGRVMKLEEGRHRTSPESEAIRSRQPLETYRRATWSSRNAERALRPKDRRPRRAWRPIVLIVFAIGIFIGISAAVTYGVHSVITAVSPEVAGALFADDESRSERIVVRDVPSDAANEVIAIAESALKDNPYGLNETHGQCLGFVDDVFGIYGQEFRRVCCATSAMKMAEPMNTDLTEIPIGACIFSDRSATSTMCDTCGKDAGHVGIYKGDGEVIHNGLTGPEIIDINEFVRTWGSAGAGGTIAWGWHAGLPL